MTDATATATWGWHYGIHPRAAGTQVRSMGRVALPLGEALRLEMIEADPARDGIVHVQYYISTEMGDWALWISCAKTDLPEHEAALQTLTAPAIEAPQGDNRR